MAFQLSNGQGSAFPNEKTSDKQPDFKGSFRGLDGVLYDLALWKKQSRDGKVFLSVKVSEYRGRDDGGVAVMLRGAEQLAEHERQYQQSQQRPTAPAPQPQPQPQPQFGPIVGHNDAGVAAPTPEDDLPF